MEEKSSQQGEKPEWRPRGRKKRGIVSVVIDLNSANKNGLRSEFSSRTSRRGPRLAATLTSAWAENPAFWVLATPRLLIYKNCELIEWYWFLSCSIYDNLLHSNGKVIHLTNLEAKKVGQNPLAKHIAESLKNSRFSAPSLPFLSALGCIFG